MGAALLYTRGLGMTGMPEIFRFPTRWLQSGASGRLESRYAARDRRLKRSNFLSRYDFQLNYVPVSFHHRFHAFCGCNICFMILFND